MTFAQLSVTNRCNLRCRMCDIGQRSQLDAGLVKNLVRDEELPAAKWLDIVGELQADDVHVLGVEPLLYSELRELLRGLREMRVSVYLTTNGFLLGEDIATVLAECCDRIAISIDGHTASLHDSIRGVPGSFDRAFRGLLRLKEMGVGDLKVSCAICPDNAAHLTDIYDLFTGRLGVPVTFNHYNYIAGESCDDSAAASSAGYDPADVDLRAVTRAVRHCRSATFLPRLSRKREIKTYYRVPPSERKTARCVVIDQILSGQRYALSPDGSFIVSTRCWHSQNLGNALQGDRPSESAELRHLADDIESKGLPPQCQRLCCAGKVL